MLRKLLIATAALGTFGVIIASPGFVAPQALAASKCPNKANKHVACTDKQRAKTQRKKAGFDAFARIEGIKGETEDKGARRGPRLRAR